MSRTLLVLCMIGCYDPDSSGSSFRCESECPDGFACVDGVCTDEPRIRIVEPQDGAELSAEEGSDLVVEVLNFQLNPDFNAEPVDGEGHWHWYVDYTYQTAEGGDRVNMGPLVPGCRTLSVDLRQNQHEALDPPQFDEITIFAADDSPTICIVSPERRERLDPGPVTVTVDVQNFDLDEEFAEGHGHWHLRVGNTQTDNHFFTSSGTVLLEGKEGQDVGVRLTVELVENDETPFDPPRTAVVLVEIAAASE